VDPSADYTWIGTHEFQSDLSVTGDSNSAPDLLLTDIGRSGAGLDIRFDVDTFLAGFRDLSETLAEDGAAFGFATKDSNNVLTRRVTLLKTEMWASASDPRRPWR
jgi:hypothetical protein